MNRSLKWCLVALVSAAIGGAVGASVATTGQWIDEQPTLSISPADFLQYRQGSKVYLSVPQLAKLPQPISVRSTIISQDRSYELTSPVMQIGDAQYEIAVPPTLKSGAYTVSIIVGYKLNPIRYVEQSYTVALLVIDGEKNALPSHSNATRPGGTSRACCKSVVFSRRNQRDDEPILSGSGSTSRSLFCGADCVRNAVFHAVG